MGFREDVSIRVTPDGEGSRVDIRSSSRYFESDLGSNAARITKLIDDINNAADNAKLKPARRSRKRRPRCRPKKKWRERVGDSEASRMVPRRDANASPARNRRLAIGIA